MNILWISIEYSSGCGCAAVRTRRALEVSCISWTLWFSAPPCTLVITSWPLAPGPRARCAFCSLRCNNRYLTFVDLVPPPYYIQVIRVPEGWFCDSIGLIARESRIIFNLKKFTSFEIEDFVVETCLASCVQYATARYWIARTHVYIVEQLIWVYRVHFWYLVQYYTALLLRHPRFLAPSYSVDMIVW